MMNTPHHPPLHPQPPRVVAIPLPDRDTADARSRRRAEADNAAWQRQQERLDLALRAVAADGEARGLHKGYCRGVRWGMFCGAVAGSLGMACVWFASTQLPAWFA